MAPADLRSGMEKDDMRGMPRKIRVWKLLCALLALCLLTGSVALSETGRGNLEERFKDEVTLEYEGEGYRPRSRFSSFLFWALAGCENAEKRLALMMIVTVDDKEKQIALVQVDPRLAVTTEAGDVPFWQACAEIEGEDRCERILALVNATLPEPLLEDYLELDIDGLELLDGISFSCADEAALEGDVKSRLKQFGETAEQASSGELVDMFDALAGYMDTNIKSGKMMKIADKADRYERIPTQPVPGQLSEAEDLLDLDPEAWLEIIVRLFYEENPY